MLYLPIEGNSAHRSPDPVMRRLTNGRLGLLAYTALDRLVEACGENQPWILMPTSDLGTLRESAGFDVVAFDLSVPRTMKIGGRIA